MNQHWIIRNHNPELILFFNGWGMDASAVSHLKGTGYDILMLNEYLHPEPLTESFSSYTNIYVVAWSMGVWAASQILSQNSVKIKKAIAINGTLAPIDDDEGICETIFKGTLAGWSGKSRDRFMMRISGGAKIYLSNREKFGTRNPENQKQELAAILNHYETTGRSRFVFEKALIGKQDAIFTVENQIKHWHKSCVKYVVKDLPHYPFLHFNSWEQIIGI